VPLEHGRGAQPELLKRAGPEVLDHHIGLRRETRDQLAIDPTGEVGRDAFLVAIDREVVRTFAPPIEGRPPPSGVVAEPGTLHFDDIRTQIAEDHGAERACKHA
jgi:hypothetical protein